MPIAVGDRLPDGTLMEMADGPSTFNVSDLARGKRIVVFGVPGAFTPT